MYIFYHDNKNVELDYEVRKIVAWGFAEQEGILTIGRRFIDEAVK